MTRAPIAAKLVGAGTTAPTVYVRDRFGRWVSDGICDPSLGKALVRRYEDLAEWAREDFLDRLLKHAALRPARKRG